MLNTIHVTQNTPLWKVVFDVYKLLDNQIDRLTEVMDKMNRGPLGRQNKKQTL